MSAEIVLQHSASYAALGQRRKELSGLRATLAERTTAFEAKRSELRLFEDRYFREAGVLYAELDALEAQIAQREVDLYDSDAARQRAEVARQSAEESYRAASNNQVEAAEFNPAASLRTLFRDVAKRIHPDLARDKDEAQYFTLLMARANRAYRRGDTDTLQRMRDDHSSVGADEDNEAGEIAQVTRHIQQAQRDIVEVQSEYDALLVSEIALLHTESQVAGTNGRDLIAELVVTLSEQIAYARQRFNLIERQIKAHGR